MEEVLYILEEQEYEKQLNTYQDYGSCISSEHTDITNEYMMTNKQVLMFGWYLCQAYINNQFDDIKNKEWFKIFINENYLKYKG